MAQHCAMAGLVEKAIEYWDKAGRLAVQRSTMAEAAAHFGKALKLLAGLPKSPQRQSSELSLQLALAGALTAAKGWASPEAGEAYARARELCRERPGGSPGCDGSGPAPTRSCTIAQRSAPLMSWRTN